MSEITKLYENAGIKPTYTDECQMADSYYSMEKDLNKRGILFDDYMKQNCPNKNEACYETCPYAYNKEFYPPFIAEKQLKLIKWLILNDFVDELDIFYRPFELMWVFKIYNVPEFANEKSACRLGADMTFEKGLASLINNLWQDLTSEEKQQVKGVLE